MTKEEQNFKALEQIEHLELLRDNLRFEVSLIYGRTYEAIKKLKYTNRNNPAFAKGCEECAKIIFAFKRELDQKINE